MLDRDVILHVEDDENYAKLLECAFQQVGVKQRLVHVPGGAEAQAYLAGMGKYSDRKKFPLPGLVLVDLKMPGIDGFDLLQWIRTHSPHPLIPVVVLTSSDELRDVRRAYQLGANSFLIKPPRPEDLREMLTMIEAFWIKLNIRNPE